ncbi:transposase family protein [Rothia sp. LK2492]|uniref:transposase family protein n=1 Tax=Rothia sp. LK2492 TaxID=3114370 RepID=UPI0034CDE4ED
MSPRTYQSGQKLSAQYKQNNRVLNRLRSVVERVIAHIKCWRVLHTGFRRPLGSYGRVFSVVRGLVFYAAGGNFE